ncbi:MAG: VOC family protein [Planctomycetota bacterium]
MPSPTPSNIYPSLSYDDAPAAIEWLCRAFGFEKRLVVPGPNGTIRHSELSLGPGVIMVSSIRPEVARVSPRSLNGVVNQALCIQIDDPDEHYARAKAAGATITAELYNAEFGSRGYSAKDPEGNYWHFGTYRPGTYWQSDSGSVG